MACCARAACSACGLRCASAAGQSLQSMEFYETDKSRGFVRGAKWNLMPTGGPLGMRSGYGGRPVEESFGVNFHRNLKKVLGRSGEWGLIAEDLPDDDNRVTPSISIPLHTCLPRVAPVARGVPAAGSYWGMGAPI